MKCLERFNRKMRLSGNSLREEKINDSKNLLRETFEDDAAFSYDYYLWEVGIKSYENKECIPIRIYGRKFSAANGLTVQFQTSINHLIEVGDILYDSRHEEYYICTESFNLDEIHYKGELTKCNWILKWQNKQGRIFEYPCYDINSTQYNSGETSNRVFTIGSSQHMITLPCDENTVIIKSPQRFYLDKDHENPTTFQVSQNDSTSMNYGSKGIVRLTVMESVASKYDRPDLGICDYIDIAEEKEVTNVEIIYDTRIIKSGGDFQKFYCKFFDDDGEEIEDIIPVWNIVCDFKDKLLISQFDNYIQIGIDNDDYIDEEFKLVLSNQTGEYTTSLIIKIESLL